MPDRVQSIRGRTGEPLHFNGGGCPRRIEVSSVSFGSRQRSTGHGPMGEAFGGNPKSKKAASSSSSMV